MNDQPFLIEVADPGEATDMAHTGFHSIGSGWDKAVAHMLWSSSKRSHPIERVLYDAFGAKARAELDVNVGYDWDAQIILPKGRTQRVPDNIKELIERVWSEYNRDAFDIREKDDLDPPPRNWKKKLRDWVVSFTQSTSQTSGAPQ